MDAVTAFVHAARDQVIAYGIRVGEISPGPVDTRLLEDWPEDGGAS